MPPVVTAVAVYAASTTAVFEGIVAAYGIAGAAVAGAVVGAAAGGATAAIMGDDIGDGALAGALSGAATGGIIGATGGAGFTSGEGYATSGGVVSKEAAAAARGNIFEPDKWQGLLTSSGNEVNVAGQAGGSILGGGDPAADAAQNAVGGIATKDGIDPSVLAMINANKEAATNATKWQMIGNAATEGAKGLFAEDPDDEIERQLRLKQADKISLSEGWADKLNRSHLPYVSPFAKRLAERQSRLDKRMTWNAAS